MPEMCRHHPGVFCFRWYLFNFYLRCTPIYLRRKKHRILRLSRFVRTFPGILRCVEAHSYCCLCLAPFYVGHFSILFVSPVNIIFFKSTCTLLSGCWYFSFFLWWCNMYITPINIQYPVVGLDLLQSVRAFRSWPLQPLHNFSHYKTNLSAIIRQTFSLNSKAKIF